MRKPGRSDWSLFVVRTVLLFPLAICLPENRCSFQNGQCTYNIQLGGPGGCNVPVPAKLEVPGDGKQNDHSRMSDMEQSFNTVKDDHEQRLLDLENMVQKFLRAAISPGPSVIISSNNLDDPPNLQRSSAPLQRKSTTNSSDGSLVSRLQNEFGRLRATLKANTMALFNTQRKLNETNEALKETQNNLFTTSEQLVLAEHKVLTMQQERYILKNQLKEKTERLSIAEEKLNISEIQRNEMDNKLYVLVRSESNCQEERQYFKWKFNETTIELNELKKEHNELQQQHSKTKRELRKRERELMECYTAKTQTFCGFEDAYLCGFTQENTTDFFNWQRVKGTTPSGNTGPDTDHTCQSPAGHFMYIEASAKSKGNNAIMYSPKYWGLEEQCAEFYYNMNGKHIGTLNVYTKTLNGGELESAWRAFGDQGNVWILARLAIPRELSRAGYQLVFEGMTESGYMGDMAIDDIRVSDGPCPVDLLVKPVFVQSTNITENTRIMRKLRRYRERTINLNRQRHGGKR